MIRPVHNIQNYCLKVFHNYNWIYGNNFFNNGINAYFFNCIINFWFGNCWDDWFLLFPRPIYGYIFLFNDLSIPWLNFDWHPAREPYDIPISEV